MDMKTNQKGMKHSVNRNGPDGRFKDARSRPADSDAYSVCIANHRIKLGYDESWVSRPFTADDAYRKWGRA